MTADPTLETVKARSKWHTVFQMPKDKNSQPRVQYPVKISFGSEGAIKAVSDEWKLRELVLADPEITIGRSSNRKETVKEASETSRIKKYE